jgi:hypothetical protein
MNIIEAIEQQSNLTTTENGAITNQSSLSKCVDFFAQGGAIRNRSESDVIAMFKAAFDENQTTAVRLAFMFRDVRGGQGQRTPFRMQIKWLATNYPMQTAKLLQILPEYGRWDDIYAVVDTELQGAMIRLIDSQLSSDMANMLQYENISLLGKWLKRINTSSKESVRIGHIIRRGLNLSEKEYRKMCSNFNAYLNVIENKMSAKQWDQIEYQKVPGQCMMKHMAAFRRNDHERFQQYITLAQAGKVKVNAGTLYPYQIIEKIIWNSSISEDEAEILWNNLTHYDVDPNALVIADVSGSMQGTPLNVCISLALYFSERAKGIFKDKFITFSSRPTLQQVTGNTIYEKANNLNSAHWEMNTNLEAVFNLVLNAAVTNNIPADEMVETLYIISDMEFDECMSGQKAHQVETLYDSLKGSFEDAGYTMPKLVFWNVDARQGNYPVLVNTPNTCMISGFSPSILQYFNTPGALPTAEDMMRLVINSPRYSSIEF